MNYILNKLKSYTENIPSLFLLILPYLIITFQDIKDVEAFSYFYFCLSLALLLVTDEVYRRLFQKSHKKNPSMFKVFGFIYAAFFIFFYENFFTRFLIELLNNHNVFLRDRMVLGIVFLLIFSIVSLINKIYLFLNRALMILSLIILVDYGLNSPIRKTAKTNPSLHEKTINVNHCSDKPIIFIILDEYSSPTVFEKVKIIKKAPDLADFLDSAGWITKRRFYSFETSTIHSISSILNGNLSDGGSSYSATPVIKVSDDLKKASVIEKLNVKHVSFKNYSFFTIANHPYYSFIYPLPYNFIDLLLSNSFYFHLKTDIEYARPGILKFDSDPTSDYNQNIYHILVSTLNQNGLPNQFIYIHLLMPHRPILFGNEIKLNGYSTIDYYTYWQFVNKKIISALKQAKHLNDYRIIISGDHGFRNDLKTIDPQQTLTAFYGFDTTDVNQLKSVQDIGALVESSFK